MISSADVDRLSEGWVREFSVDPYVLKHREMKYWHELDQIIFSEPADALRVFERVSKMELSNWTLEGMAVGPLRTFLMLYDKTFEQDTSGICKRSPVFAEMYAMAVDGL